MVKKKVSKKVIASSRRISPSELPRKMPRLIKLKLYDLTPLPETDASPVNSKRRNREGSPANLKRKYKVSCTQCNHSRIVVLPLDSTNLRSHWKIHHPDMYQEKIEEYEEKLFNTSVTKLEDSFETYSSPSTLQLASSSIPQSRGSPQCGSNSGPDILSQQLDDFSKFDPNYFKALVLKFLFKENLPFCTVDSPEFHHVLNYARLCKDGELPRISCHIKNEHSTRCRTRRNSH